MKALKQYKKQIVLFSLFFLIIGNFLVWQEIYHIQNNNLLKVIFLDVGQGDSILIEAPNGNQLLIDGGPDNKVIEQLGKNMKFFDRSINALLTTHADRDHINGLISVLGKYKIKTFLDTDNETKTQNFLDLKELIKNKGVQEININPSSLSLGRASKNIEIILDKKHQIYLEILFPENSAKDWETNMASVVTKLIYKNKSFIFTGDSPAEVEKYLVSAYGKSLKADVLKLGHHGSKTSSSEEFLEAIDPDYAIVSAGLNNSYGHPSPETLDKLKNLKIKYLETSKVGGIEFDTDGNNLELVTENK